MKTLTLLSITLATTTLVACSGSPNERGPDADAGTGDPSGEVDVGSEGTGEEPGAERIELVRDALGPTRTTVLELTGFE